jgi:Zn-dependent M28 family amino/carboxypeptidase
MEFLAGDALNGRGSGTRDEWIAVQYAAGQMRRLAIDPLGDAGGYVQAIPAPGGGRTWNAVGRLTGSDPEARTEVILLSAHIDHLGNRSGQANPPPDPIYNGADDDASGTVAVLELMEALARGPRARRSVVFALFGSEERGGLGSRHFVGQPTVPLARIVANLQFEMIGRPDAAVAPRTIWLTGFERSNLGPELARLGARLVQDPHPEMNFFMRSDNIRFARLGVVAHTVSSFGLHKEYHTPGDDISRIDFAHMADAVDSLVEPIRRLADSTFRPEWRPGMKP